MGYLMIVGSTLVANDAIQAAMDLDEYAETAASGAVEPVQAVIAVAVAAAAGAFIYIRRHWRRR